MQVEGQLKVDRNRNRNRNRNRTATATATKTATAFRALPQRYTTEKTPSLYTFAAVKSCISCGCCCGSIILNHVSAVEDAVEVH